MDQELREYLDRQFKSIDESFNERFNGVEADIRRTNVVVEDLRDQVKLVANGVATVDAKLERFRGEVAQELKDVRAAMHLPYPPLDRRVTSLEARVEKLEKAPPPRKRPPTSRARGA